MDSKEEKAVCQILNELPYPVVVSLGAYHGEDDERFRGCLKNPQSLTHIMVEADPANCDFIERNVPPRDPQVVLIRGAIGDRDGNRIFYPSYDSRDGSTGSGSLRMPTGHLETFPTISFSNPFTVACYTLDHLTRSLSLKKIDLLWVDIQGAEREMIAGGEETLAKSRYCFMEAEGQEFYEGQALKPELISIMDGLGWELMEDFGFNILLRNTRL